MYIYIYVYIKDTVHYKEHHISHLWHGDHHLPNHLERRDVALQERMRIKISMLRTIPLFLPGTFLGSKFWEETQENILTYIYIHMYTHILFFETLENIYIYIHKHIWSMWAKNLISSLQMLHDASHTFPHLRYNGLAGTWRRPHRPTMPATAGNDQVVQEDTVPETNIYNINIIAIKSQINNIIRCTVNMLCPR